MVKTVLIAVVLAVFVGFLAFAADDPYNVTLPVVPVFFCILIIAVAGIIIEKINKLSKKVDLLLKDKCSCQKEEPGGD